MYKYRGLLAIICLTFTSLTFANTTVNMNFTAENGQGESAGIVTISETKYGLLFTPNLHGLTPGPHGFHLHEHPSCDHKGMAAGSHLDPKHTNKHLGPYDDAGHLGDLPVLYVNADGTATTPVLAPRLKHISDITNHTLMIHQDGDNYSDVPAPLGGGGSRTACGVIGRG